MGKEAAKTKEEMQAIARKNEISRIKKVRWGEKRVWYGTVRHGTARYGTVRHGTVGHS